MKTRNLVLAIILTVIFIPAFSQLAFEKNEYVARREKLMDMIPEGIAIIRGATIPGGGAMFFQCNNMIYFTGL